MFFYNFKTYAVYEFLFLGVIVFLAFRALRFLMPLLVKRKELRRQLYRYLPVSELLVWLVFIIWSVQFFLRRNQLFAIALLCFLAILIFWLSRFLLKDFLAGVVFKTTAHFSVYDTIRFNDTVGKITRFNQRSLEIETSEGNILFIPYSELIHRTNIKTEPAETISRFSFRLKTFKHKELAAQKTALKRALLHLPWISVKKEPQIVLVAETDNHFEFDITVFAPERKYYFLIENTLKKQFEAA